MQSAGAGCCVQAAGLLKEVQENENIIISAPRDRNGSLVKNRLATQHLEDVVRKYINACSRALAAVQEALQSLASRLEVPHLPAHPPSRCADC